jgi:hypothetical protein
MRQIDYGAVRLRLAAHDPASVADYVRRDLPQQLSDMWLDAYAEAFPDASCPFN